MPFPTHRSDQALQEDGDLAKAAGGGDIVL